MKRVGVITIGDELLNGSTLDTHLNYIAKSLYSHGVKVDRHITIKDESHLIIDEIKEFTKKVEIVIITGGLGPTPDDRTLAAVSKLFGTKLIKSEVVENDILNFFSRLNREPNQLSLDQAYVVAGGNYFRNLKGTSPAHHLQFNDRFELDSNGEYQLFLLPGVPYEMRELFDNHIKNIIIDSIAYFYKSRTINTFGIGESNIVERITNLSKIEGIVDIGFYPQTQGVKVVLTAEGDDGDRLDQKLDKAEELLSDDLKSYRISSSGVVEELVSKLLGKGLKISLAESCSGGLAAYKIISIPGASRVVDRSYITYSNQAKFEILGVSPYTLEVNGAVSDECVDEMLDGLIAETKSDIVGAISGIAGPDGGTKDKPVGTVFVGIAMRSGKKVIGKYFFNGDRETIQSRSVYQLYNMILKLDLG